MRKLFAFPTIVISLLLTVLSAFFGLSLPAGLKGLDGCYVWDSYAWGYGERLGQ